MSPATTAALDGPLRLAAEGVAVRLGGRLVLQGVDLALARGQSVAVVGPNGSGKSTLLRAVAGLLRLAAGCVRLDGRPLDRLRRRDVARQIALMPQHADLHFPLTGLEAVLLGRSPHQRGLGLAGKHDLGLAESAMAALDVAGLADRPVTAVSGGELQRLMLARVLVQEARFALLDEPTSAQDPLGTLRVRDVLRRLTAAGTGVLVAVHDLNLALRDFDEIAVMAGGTLLYCGPTVTVLASGALERAFGVRLRQIDDNGHPWIVAERPGG